MSISKLETSFTEISEPVGQEGILLSHCSYHNNILHVICKHTNPSKIHATSSVIKISMVSIQEIFLVCPRLIPDCFSLNIYHSRQA